MKNDFSMMKQVRKWASPQTEVASLLGTFPLMLCSTYEERFFYDETGMEMGISPDRGG